MIINLDDGFVKQVKKRMKEMCVEFEGTPEDFESYIERLITEDIGNV